MLGLSDGPSVGALTVTGNAVALAVAVESNEGLTDGTLLGDVAGVDGRSIDCVAFPVTLL